MTDPTQIAAKLSKAQRRWMTGMTDFIDASELNGLYRMNLVVLATTDLGQSVRAILSAEHGQSVRSALAGEREGV